MPLTYAIFPEDRLVVSRAWGHLTFAEAVDHTKRLGADPEFRPDFDHLLDAMAVATVSLTSDQVAEIAKMSVFSASSRRAIIAGSTLGYGLGRMYEAHRDSLGQPDVRVFRDRQSACEWLGVARSTLRFPA